MDRDLIEVLGSHLSYCYPDHDTKDLTKRILDTFWPGDLRPRELPKTPNYALWSEHDCVLITYGDSFVDGENAPLSLLQAFLDKHVKDSVSGVHILPFYPYSSDDGFAVIDYIKVNPELGDWSHVASISEKYRLMADMVLNHASSYCEWFNQFRLGVEPGKDYFVVAEECEELAQVVRPRPSKLLRKTRTPEGPVDVWCTFSHDQVDLNFHNPDVLIEFIKIMRHYLDHGVQIFRLDAVAFLWKKLGTNCIHLPETHEIIRLFRTLSNYATENVVLITETNVPNHENLTYFGNQNEAHIIYNFSLPPLTVQALMSGDSSALRRWMMSMPPAQEGCAYLNFTASHDGIGLRPAEGLLAPEDIGAMLKAVQSFGGQVSMRDRGDGIPVPYEMNISLFEAMKGTLEGEDEFQIERFLCSQTIMLALEGVPAIYVHSLLATPNDQERFHRTKHNRALNRHKWHMPELEERLADETSPQHKVFHELTRRIALRSRQAAFHPNATQFTLALPNHLFGFWRQSRDRKQSIFAIYNLTKEEQSLALHDINLIAGEDWIDLLTAAKLEDRYGELTLKPYQAVWITNAP